jgi:hypothetical protein
MIGLLPLLGQASPPTDPWIGWAVAAIAAMFVAITGGVTWFATIHSPAHDKQITELLAKHDRNLQAQRDECRAERIEQYARFEQAILLIQSHNAENTDQLREDIAKLTRAIEHLSESFTSLRNELAAGRTKKAGPSGV